MVPWCCISRRPSLLIRYTTAIMLLFNTSVPLSVDFDSPEDYFIFLFHFVFATIVVFVAGSVAITISTTKSLLRQNRFIFMLNTSISDTLVGFSVYYLGLFDVQEGFPSRNGTYYILPSLQGININTFLFAQFDRYFAVCHPFFYGRYITQPIVIGACLYSWLHTYLLLLAMNVVPISTAALINAFSIVALQIVVVTKIIMTVKLYVVARYQLERDPPSADKENKKESLKIILFVVVFFLILWFPAFVSIILKQQGRLAVRFRNEATDIFHIMARSNALMTPAVYIWGSPALREALKKTLRGKLCSKLKIR